VDSGSSGEGKTLEDGTTARIDGKNRWQEQMAKTDGKNNVQTGTQH